MKIPRRIALAVALSLALPAAATRDSGEAAVTAAIGDRQVLAPVDCIDPRDVRSTRIVGRTAIVYEAVGRLYVNRPAGAAALRRDDVLVSRVEGGQLCRVDTLTLLDPVTRQQRGFVVLGPFQSYAPRL